MTAFRVWLSRCVGALTGRRAHRQIDDEIETHLELLTQEYEQRGLSAHDARRAARRAFGGVTQAKEAWRDERQVPFASVVSGDARYAVRALRHSPPFAVAAILTIGLAVAVSTLVFRVGYSLLVKPLPYAEPESLVTIASRIPKLPPEYPSVPVRAKDFLRFRSSNVGLADIGAVSAVELTLTGQGEPEMLHGARVSASLFPMLGVEAMHGRTFRADEDAPGRNDVVVISHDLWVRRFGAGRGVLDAPISLNGRPHMVVGVLPPGALFPTGKQLHPLVGLGPRVDVWRPMAFSNSDATSEGDWNYAVIGRLAKGVSGAQAENALNAVAKTINDEIRRNVPGLDLNFTMLVTPLRDVYSRTGREGLRTIALAAVLLCLIACINLAHLWLGRIAEREHELVVRASLGASGRTIARQLFTEAAVLAVPGAAIGFGLAQLGARGLVAFGPADLASMDVSRIDATATAFAVAMGGLGALLAAAGPIWRAVRVAAGRVVGGRYVGRGVRQSRTRRVLVAAETAVCTGMLGVSALVLHSLANVWALDRGFVADEVTTVDLSLPSQSYPGNRVVPFYADLLTRLQRVPGIRSTAATSAVPLSSEESTAVVFFESDELYTMDRPLMLQRGVTPDYFETMMIPLVAGRVFDEREPENVVIVSSVLARQLWPADPPQNILGRRVRVGDVKGQLRTIVGIVGDVRDGALDRRSLPGLYRPHEQYPSRAMTVVIRTAGPSSAIMSAIRAELRGLDANLPVVSARPMSDIVAESVAPRRFQSLIVSVLAALALALACVGVYGAASYAVSSGTREVGVRVALGAAPRSVFGLVFFQGVEPVLVGVALGIAASPVASSFVRHLLFQVGPLDPWSLGAVALVLVAVAGIVCYVPARRAARIDPVVALRQE